jgi:hypothetical protein
MNDNDTTQDRWLTTEQIATAGNAPDQQNVPDQGDAPDQEHARDQESAPDQEYARDQESARDQEYAPDQESAPDQEYAPDQDAPAPAGHPGYEDGNVVPLAADHAASGQADRIAAGNGNGPGAAADPAARARLLEDGELQSLKARWKDIQAEFVEEPTTAVRQADALVAELMQRLATMFASERADLENRWAGGTEVSTEDLRQGLRRYRSFFERLLAA